jgi:hypothetical protein
MGPRCNACTSRTQETFGASRHPEITFAHSQAAQKWLAFAHADLYLKLWQKSCAGVDAPESVERADHAELNFLRDEVHQSLRKIECLEGEKVAMQAKFAQLGKLSVGLF